MGIPGLRGLPPWSFAKQLYSRLSDNNVLATAAQLAYYFLFSLFPLLFFLVALGAYLPLQDEVSDLLGRLSAIMPREGLQILQDHLQSLLNDQHPKLLSLSLVLAIWSASRGVDAFRNALNLSYGVKDARPYWRVQLIAIGVTLASTLLVLSAFTALVLGGKLGFFLADRLHIGRAFAVVWAWLRWPTSALAAMLAVALIYYVLPDVKQRFKFITPGSVLGTLLWLLASWGFTQYAEHFGNYNATYGSIGGVVVLMTWLYISSLIFVLGGELNALIEHLAPDGKAPGEAAPGQPAQQPDSAAGAGGLLGHPALGQRGQVVPQ